MEIPGPRRTTSGGASGGEYEVKDKTGTTKNTYDKGGRLIRVQYPGSKTVSYQYDAAGNRTRLTYPDSSNVTYEYDSINRMTYVRNSGGTALAHYTYNDLGRRSDLDYANGAYVDYSYDVAGRLLYADNRTNNGQHKYAYTYDYVGNRATMQVTDSSGTRTSVYDYDATYQLTGADYPPELSYLATDTTFNKACPERSERDAAGNRTSVIDGSGTTNYTSNSLNQYSAAGAVNYQYDDNGNMTHDGTYVFTYDQENRLKKAQRSGAAPSATLAEALDLSTTCTTGGAANWQPEWDTLWDWAYSGSIGDDQESWVQTTVSGAATLKFWWKVSSEEGCDKLEFYLDNELQDAISGSVDWHQMSYTVSGTGSHTLKWRYVKDGSSSSGDDQGWVDHVQWLSATQADPASNSWRDLSYVYDASGRRIEKKYEGITILQYVYDGDHCIAEYDAADNLKRKYIYGPGVDQPVCMIEAAGTYAGTYYYHFDALGSVVALTNSSGNTVQVYDYAVYGQVGASDASHPNRFMFTGRECDKETGLYYYRARYYNPEIGRFLQADLVGYKAGMNLYQYCRNSPTNMIDPLGREPDAANGRYVYPMDDQDAADPCGCWQTLQKRLQKLQIEATDCLTEYPGSVFAKNVAACIAACFWAAYAGGTEGYAACEAGCLALTGVVDAAVVSACKQAVQANIDSAYEHYNFCMCKKNKGSTKYCAKKYISDPCDPAWAKWFSSGWNAWIDWFSF